ncbi:MAG: sortase, partial [Oscillospiraceae bacterium]
NSTYLYTLGKAKKGDLIQFNTSYGKYVYQITGSKIAVDTDVSAYDLTREADNLIIYTCYPFDRLGFTADRYFVYADYLSGPTINVPY